MAVLRLPTVQLQLSAQWKWTHRGRNWRLLRGRGGQWNDKVPLGRGKALSFCTLPTVTAPEVQDWTDITVAWQSSANRNGLLSQCFLVQLRSSDTRRSDLCPESEHPLTYSTSSTSFIYSDSRQTPEKFLFISVLFLCFLQCASLRRFIHPLLELLHGLKTGRFDKGIKQSQV